jgi:hypothetical protein
MRVQRAVGEGFKVPGQELRTVFGLKSAGSVIFSISRDEQSPGFDGKASGSGLHATAVC